ncbi:MAG: UDP-N-acetylmuramoyl-L-alanyl-D-glutamate--2,6-diaminopimelate ligase [Gammaproteobacteria bacterium]|nr:UDP-N-acetylmuramoyl-L-alanyl-D-glutamate--2,6-diaminopimelate ligase [Gammaproteobacteria bacterium]
MMPAVTQTERLSLYELLDGIVAVEKSLQSIMPSGLSLDSRQTRKGDVFFALSGCYAEGLRFARDALQAGAVAIVHESVADEFSVALTREHNVPLIYDPDLESHLGEIAARFYGKPSQSMKVIAITGTDGKTSVSHFIAQALDRAGQDNRARAAVIGTVGTGFFDDLRSATHTTPDPIALQARMAELYANGAAYIAMEASSHGLEQGRINGTQLELAVLTNLGRDHLDYHGDIESYQQAKQRLFSMPGLKGAVLNWQDPFGQLLLETYCSNYPISVYSIGQLNELKQSVAADWVCAERLECAADGLHMHIVMPDAAFDLVCNLLGEFNALNVLAAAAVLRRLGWSAELIAERLAQLKSVPGRMQLISQPNKAQVVIDYAHTPQALRSALNALRGHCRGKLWCVFGCGGDRDTGKRPQMGGIADSLADRTIITNDNPRHEAPERIAEEIQEGMRDGSGALVILDRTEAIAAAIQQADRDDLILLAGKGHETTQQIGDEFLPFSDQAVVERCLGIAT